MTLSMSSRSSCCWITRTPPESALANVRVLIVDPDVNYRTDLRKQLQRAGLDVVGEADYGADALTLASDRKRDAIAIAWQDRTIRGEQPLEPIGQLLPSSPLLGYSGIAE